MDEIEWKRSFNNLKVLIDNVAHVDARNALQVVAHMLQDLDERITELQVDAEDDGEEDE